MADPFTLEQIEQLSEEITQQLSELALVSATAQRAGGCGRPRAQRQWEAIEKATGQNASTFLALFRAAVRTDLCEQGGVLHGQLSKFKDLVTKDTLDTFGGILIGLGLSGSALHVVTVALVVYVFHLGAEAFCTGEE